MTFIKGTKLYCNADSPIKTLDGGEIKNNIPFGQEQGFSRTYYGEADGAGTEPQDILWQPASFIGLSTGRTAIKEGVLYYEFSMESSYRHRSEWPYFGAGRYQPITRSGWVSSEYCTDSEANALTKYDKRTDKAKFDDVKIGNKTGKPAEIGGSSVDEVPGPETKNNTVLYVGLGVFGLSILGVIIYFITRKK